MSKAHLTRGVALLILAGACAAAHGRQAAGEGLYRAALPGRGWAIDLRLHDFLTPAASVDRRNSRWGLAMMSLTLLPWESLGDDGLSYRLHVFQKPQKNPERRAALELAMRPTDAQGAAEFRAAELKKLERLNDAGGPFRVFLNRDSIKTSEYNGVPVARYSVRYEHDNPVYGGGSMPVGSAGPRHIIAYYVRDGVGVTLTLMARSVGEGEERLFHSLLDSVKLVDVTTPSSSFDFYHRGRLLILQKDFPAAAAALARAFELERSEPRLEPAAWRDLVVKLADARAALGDAALVRRALEEGLAREPDTPVFHMGLARLDASLGNREAALAALDRAFFYMKKEAPRAQLPDLSFDPVFRSHLKDAKFEKSVRELRKKHSRD